MRQPETEMLLLTKLHRRQLTRDLIPRTHLINAIDDLRCRPFTLVSAPAGYGKSTMASLWLKAWNGPSGWVSLDDEENDLRVFIAYLLAAIQSSKGAGFSNACNRIQSLLEAPNLPSMAVLCRYLLNDLEEIEDPFILVLDDYHKIHDPNVHKLMSGLMDHPSSSMHLILLTRRDPPLSIHKLRGRGQINEIGIYQLRFTLEETALFLKQNLGIAVTEASVAAIHERLEGWAAGMHLMLHSLAHKKNLKHLLDGLQGGFGAIIEYLLAEVLSQQPAEVANRMVATAILDRFCDSLCDAISDRGPGKDSSTGDEETDHGGMDGTAFISHLKTHNLFLTPLDAENRWFRYHHLFQDLLIDRFKQRYSTKDISTCHSRASAWFAENDYIDEALRHALAAGEMPRAIRLIERHRQAALNSNRWHVLEKWLDRLPDTEIEKRPELMMTKMWICYFKDLHTVIPRIFAAVEALLSDKPEEQPLYGEIFLFKAVFSFWQGDIPLSLQYVEDALDRIPETQPMVRGFAEIYLGLAGHMDGQTETVLQVLFDLLDHSSMQSPRKFRVLVSIVWVHLLAGDLAVASIRNTQLIDNAAKKQSGTFGSWGAYNQGIIHLCRNELDLAIHFFNHAVETGFLILKRANIDCLVGLALAYQANQQPEEADQTIGRLLELIDSFNAPALLEIAYTTKARLALMRGDAVPTHRFPLTAPASDRQPMVFWLELPAITNCRVLIADGLDIGLVEAEKRLTLYLQLNRAHHNTFRIIEILSLLSLAVYQQGRLDEALQLLDEAVKLGEPGGFVQPFIELSPSMASLLKRLYRQNVAADFICRILSVHKESEQNEGPADQSPRPSQPLVEPLTHRELDVLELLAQRLQNKEIAEKLFVSTQTVKTHLKNIYQKLNVTNRRKAVSEAYRHGIITHR